MPKQGLLLPIANPGGRGVNREQAASLLAPAFATDTENTIIDSDGRLAARLGYTDNTSTKVTSTPTIDTVFEYINQAGTKVIISAWAGGIGTGTDDPENDDNLSGTGEETTGRYDMHNFNDKVIAFCPDESAQEPLVYTGTGNMDEITESGGTAPKGGIGFAGLGRVWGVDSDLTTIKYSSLLDEAEWSGGTSGSIDMANIWTKGTDEVTAIRAFNGDLVVFGRNHIVFWTDGKGSQLGLDPTEMYVSDIIEGTGCVSVHTISALGDTDMIFLSPHGVQSLARLTQGRSNPVVNLSMAVQTALRADYDAETEADIRGVYSPKHGFYLLSFPSQKKTYCFNFRAMYQNEQTGAQLPAVTEWDLAPNSMAARQNGDLLFGLAGEIGTHDVYGDDAAAYNFVYESPWMALGQDVAQVLKMIKRIGTIFYTPAAATVNIEVFVDFGITSSETLSRSVDADSGDEYGTAQWETAEFGGGLALRVIRVPARRKGQYFRIKISSSVANQFALQQLDIFTKLGRLA